MLVRVDWAGYNGNLTERRKDGRDELNGMGIFLFVTVIKVITFNLLINDHDGLFE